jgi:1-acyl-sn-glycerol-3-phosphate acyltransferase
MSDKKEVVIDTTPPPLEKRRKKPGHPLVYNLTRWFFLAYFRIGGVKVFGQENIPLKGRFVFAPNHVSHLDPPMVSIYSPRRPHALAKSELVTNKLVGLYYRGLGAFPIARGKADRRVIRYAIELLKNEEPLLIFPEGTRSKTGEFGEAEIGLGMIAHAAKAPIIPVYIRGTQNALSSVRPGVRFVKSEIHYGKPLLFEEEYSRRGDRETLEAIGNRTMQEIIAMRERAEKERPY